MLYFVVVTLATVGYGDVMPFTGQGKVYSIYHNSFFIYLYIYFIILFILKKVRRHFYSYCVSFVTQIDK